MVVSRRSRALPWLVPVSAAAVAIGWGWSELHYSQLQAKLFAGVAQGLSYEVKPGPARGLRFPESGPYDERLGYSSLKRLLPRLASAGYGIEAQARQSRLFTTLTGLGIYPIYREKAQAGLELLDRDGRPLYRARHPGRQYRSFDAIPQPVVSTLLFVENRDLLDDERPSINPAVEWDRLALAVVMQAARSLDAAATRLGGSTLATQIEKFRHSPGGRTRNAGDKLRQMLSASLRAYIDGEESLQARRRIVVDFLNSVPLGAVPGYGEVIGLGDAMWAWYGREFDEVNAVLSGNPGDDARAGAIFKEVLSLVVAQRRPSELLAERPDRLAELTDSYVRLLAREGLIAHRLRDAALAAPLAPRRTPIVHRSGSFVERKAINAVRSSLAALLDIDSAYALDRYDLTVRTTLDRQAQEAVTDFLVRMGDEAFLRRHGFKDRHLLASGDPREVRYSFTLYEATPLGNLLRVHADNVERPFDINAGVKLDLGSSAKLRTLITYLEIIADLHARYAHIPDEGLAVVPLHPEDRLSRWAIDHVLGTGDRSLSGMLRAALQRRYSASPHETFFTGGGLHTFRNFDEADDARRPTLAEALEKSINLPFIRLMRDIVHYYAYEEPGAPGRPLLYGDERRHRELLQRFIEQDNRVHLQHFWRKYGHKRGDALLDALADSVRPFPERLVVVFRALRPHGSAEELAAFLRQRLGPRTVTPERVAHLHAVYAPDHFSLRDIAYLARVHPLEIWLASFLAERPGAKFEEALEASAAVREQVYGWLFESRSARARELRVRMVLEEAAFGRIAQSWRRLGYPFAKLVPSFATAIGVSADRPSGLTELMGIIVNGGVRRPRVGITGLHFAAGTPFETMLTRRDADAERVLPQEVAEVVREVLGGVVLRGTARRVAGAYRDALGRPLEIGGKTGTGDHRRDVVGRHGQVLSSKVMNRAATFTFYLGDRFFGTVTAFVPGRQAAGYEFTSALPVQILKELRSALLPLLDAPPETIEAQDEGRAPG